MTAQEESATIRVVIAGRVQRVGFRLWVSQQADARKLHGWVRNHHTGEVEAVFSGSTSVVEDMISMCHEGPTAARVESVQRFPTEVLQEKGFQTLPTV